MSRTDRIEFRHRDIPQLEGFNINVTVGGGSGSDYEHVVAIVPDLSKLNLVPSGYVGALPINYQVIRLIMLVWEANVTGVATNNFTINFNQRRAGNLLVNTTINNGSSIGPGLVTVQPTSITNIFNGMQLSFTGGTAETVTVFNVQANASPATFQCQLVNSHANASAIVSVPLATITYAAGVNDTAFIPRYFTPTPHFLKAGDIITMQRVSNGTGLSNPSGSAIIDWMGYANAL